MLNRLAAELAAEIASHDWSDAPFRLDRAGHQRSVDSKRSDDVLDSRDTDVLRTNVMLVTAQVLMHADPNLNLHEYAAACGVPRSISHRTNGSRSDVLTYGLRWEDVQAGVLQPPGAPLYRVRAQCEVANLTVFKRLLNQIGKFDPAVPLDVESMGGVLRVVTVGVRDWSGAQAAGERAAELVSAASLAVMDGGPAEVTAVESVRGG